MGVQNWLENNSDAMDCHRHLSVESIKQDVPITNICMSKQKITGA